MIAGYFFIFFINKYNYMKNNLFLQNKIITQDCNNLELMWLPKNI